MSIPRLWAFSLICETPGIVCLESYTGSAPNKGICLHWFANLNSFESIFISGSHIRDFAPEGPVEDILTWLMSDCALICLPRARCHILYGNMKLNTYINKHLFFFHSQPPWFAAVLLLFICLRSSIACVINLNTSLS